MALQVKDLTFSYGITPVLKNVSFEATSGDLIAVIGPNGVGKSTLFKCILGFLQNFDGCVSVDGVEIKNMTRSEIAQKIAYIPQSSTQVFDYTALELVMMGLAPRLKKFETPTSVHEEECLEVMNDLGIASLALRGCGEISGGEFQLVLLARALVQKARILLMDEPTANLDYGNQFKVMKRIDELAERGYVILTSTHDPNQVFLHANRTLVLRDGEVLADGHPDVVLTEPLLSDLYSIYVAKCKTKVKDRIFNVCVPYEYDGETIC